MKRKRILLADDHADNLEWLTVALSDKYQVSGYASGEEALRSLEQVKPDLLVLDVVMGPIDGVQCLEAIRGRPGYADIPAVALTAMAGEVAKAELLAAGFQAVVEKPILDERELHDAIDSLLLLAMYKKDESALFGETSAA
jgi:CheY-like chemotaxis protein